MKRRLFLAATFCFPFVSLARAQPKPWRLSLLDGGGDLAGIAIDLDEGWKTYWRMPGEAGVSPQFDWSGTQGAKDIQVFYPLPQRHHDASGEAVGYLGRVVFPVRLTPEGKKPVILDLKLFFAVCKDICIPAQGEARGTLSAAAPDKDEILSWMAKVPVAGEIVTKAKAEAVAQGVVIDLGFSAKANEVFVESNGDAYFGAPELSADGMAARLPVGNVKSAAELRGAQITVTVAADGGGVEQRVTVS
ncbi:protein-disulfide reductase DsbD domain-containing protein [Aestuariivirga sp.]|uniref:protein-disulfide reductase DsbD domain-containing protein n=1 Tax=Aestuariivirga sp. TaxID=2650926 RepID=UPI0039E397CE